MKKFTMMKLASAAVLATLGLAAQAQGQIRAGGPDWSLIISGPQVVVPPPPPAHIAPVRPAPVVVPAPVQAAPVQGQVMPRHDNGWDRERGNWERDRADYDRRFQEREHYYQERERAFLAREKAFLEREKQRQLVVENNQRASAAINDRQEQQLDKIVAGVNNNTVSKEEFTSLMAQQKQISNQERAFLGDGFMSQDEYRQLTVQLDQAEQAISFASRPERRRDYRSLPEQRFFPQSR